MIALPRLGSAGGGPVSQPSEILGAIPKIRERRFPILGMWDNEGLSQVMLELSRTLIGEGGRYL